MQFLRASARTQSSIAEINRRTYERTAPDWWTDALVAAEQTIFANYADAIDGRQVLDIGVGNGRTTAFLAPRARRYLGIDYSEAAVANCVQRFPHLGNNIQWGDARDLKFPDESFEFVLFSFNGIDYVEHDDRLRILGEVLRVLKPAGVFAFSSHDLRQSDKVAGQLFRSTTAADPRQWANPARVVRAGMRLQRRMLNRMRNKRHEQRFGDYAIINDGGLEFALLHYYITPEAQRRQLASAGFSDIQVYEDSGDNPDSLYYSAVKPA